MATGAPHTEAFASAPRACDPGLAHRSQSSLIEPLRREPAEHCISTAEACAAALRQIEGAEGERAAEHLEGALAAMVAEQLRHKPPAPERTPTRSLRSLRSQLSGCTLTAEPESTAGL